MIKFPEVQNQVNGVDCGIHAIANAVLLCFQISPDSVKYVITRMRSHLHGIFTTHVLEVFPCMNEHIVENPSYKEPLKRVLKKVNVIQPSEFKKIKKEEVLVKTLKSAGEKLDLPSKINMNTKRRRETLNNDVHIHENDQKTSENISESIQKAEAEI